MGKPRHVMDVECFYSSQNNSFCDAAHPQTFRWKFCIRLMEAMIAYRNVHVNDRLHLACISSLWGMSIQDQLWQWWLLKVGALVCRCHVGRGWRLANPYCCDGTTAVASVLIGDRCGRVMLDYARLLDLGHEETGCEEDVALVCVRPFLMSMYSGMASAPVWNF